MRNGKWTLAVLLVLAVAVMIAGCGTILHGKVPEHKQGKMDVAAFVLNLIFFWPGIFVDLATGGFWVPKGS